MFRFLAGFKIILISESYNTELLWVLNQNKLFEALF